MKKFMAVFVALVVVLQSAPFARSESSVSVVDESRITGTYSGQQFTLQRTFDPVTQDLNKQWFDQAIRYVSNGT